MRFTNRTQVTVPRRFFVALAEALGLAGALPGALRDDIGMYSENSLTVGIRKLPETDDARSVTSGWYTYGEIRLYACPDCTLGSLTHTFLHELAHAWLHQFEESTYDLAPHCHRADRFADVGYQKLGGALPQSARCREYLLELSKAERELDSFRSFARAELERAVS
jgi:hypothetical protein